MLGMMNCSSDQIEFYAANTADRKYTSQYSQEQTKAFTEVKHRPQISYTQDGRRLIDGNLEKEVGVDGVRLWHEVIKKKTLSPTTLAIPGVDTDATSVEEDGEAVMVAVGEPVLASKKIKKRIERKADDKE